jgi:putative transposase
MNAQAQSLVEWFSAADLAGLPGMPRHPQGVRRRAAQAGWSAREESAPGGLQRFFHIDSLPARTKAALKWRSVSVATPEQVQQLGKAQGAGLSLRAHVADQINDNQHQADLAAITQAMPIAPTPDLSAKLAILAAFDAFSVGHAGPALSARLDFCRAFNARELELEASVFQARPQLSVATLKRMQDALKRGLMQLADKRQLRKRREQLLHDAALSTFLQAMLVEYPHAQAPQVLDAMSARFGADVRVGAVKLPSLPTLWRAIKRWKKDNAEVLCFMHRPDTWRNKYMLAFGSASQGITELNQVWEIDSTPSDVTCDDGRHTLICVIDVATRRAAIHVSRSEKSTAVAALYRRVLMAWGVPQRVRMDNGAAFRSKHMDLINRGLEIEADFCQPFQPQQKPHIERFQQTFSHGLAELLPGHIGHSVAERKDIEARKSFAERLTKAGGEVTVHLTGAQLQEFCDRWLNSVYMHSAHSGLKGATPWEAVQAARTPARVIQDERLLDLLLATVPDGDGIKTVSKKGVKHMGTWFQAIELSAWVGKRVLCRFDDLQNDMGQLFVFDPEDRGAGFICVAVAHELLGADRTEVANVARAQQRERVAEMRRQLKAEARNLNLKDVAHEVLLDKERKARSLTALPKPTLVHQSEGIDHATDALAEMDATPGSSADLLAIEGVQERWNAMRAQAIADDVPTGIGNELAARRAPVQPIFDTPQQRAVYCFEQARIRELTLEERVFLDSFKKDQPRQFRDIKASVAERYAQAEADEASDQQANDN